MGSSLSKVSREKLKRKNDPVVLSEDEEPSTLHCKRLKLDDTMEQEERSKTRDSQVPADEMRAMREQLSEFSTQSQAFTEILSSCLKCVECKEYPRGRPLFSCAEHHQTCADCHQNPGLCARCGGAVAAEESVSPLKKKLLLFVTRNCCWHSEGCSHQADLRAMVRHELNCSYQLVTCWACDKNAALLKFHHHSEQLTCFYMRKMFQSPVTVKMSVRDSHAVALTFAGDIFYLRVTQLKSRAVWLVYLAAQLSLEDCHKYKARLELSSSEHQGGISRLPGQPSSLVQSLQDVIRSGNYILVSEPDIINISGPTGFFNLSCEITRN